MKEKDLDKCLDNLVIKGLMREAEQDNAEFEAAMKSMSDEDFLALIYDTVEEPTFAMEKETIMDEMPQMAYAPSPINLEKAQRVSGHWDERDASAPQDLPKKSYGRQKGWKIWTAAIASVAAILLIVFVPAYRYMDSRLCDSALLASEAYMGNTRGSAISSMSEDEIKSILPKLEKEYTASIQSEEILLNKKVNDQNNNDYYLSHANSQEAGIELVQAYLKLNRKDKAIDTLRELADRSNDPKFKEYCQKLLEILK